MFVSIVQPPSLVWLFAATWTVACQASLTLTISWSLPKFMFIALVMLSSHFILWCPLLFLPLIFPNIKDFPNESAVQVRWSKYWSFSFIISPSNKYSGLISLKIDWFDLLSKGLSGVFFWMLWWCKCYTHSVEVILWIFIFPGLGICSILLSHDTGQCQKSEPQLPVSHWIMRVNNQYTYNHAVSIQTSCFSLLVQHSTNYLKYSTLLKNRLVLDDFVQL